MTARVWMLKQTMMLAMLAMLALIVGACGDDGTPDFKEGGDPIISSDKVVLSFSVVTLGGDASPEVFTLSNTGFGPLLVNDMRITGEGAEFFTIYIDRGSPYVDGDFELKMEYPDNQRDILVEYLPTKEGKAEASLTIYSNDPATPEFVIELNALEIGPLPQVVPNPVVFGQVSGGDTDMVPVNVANVGSAHLTILKVYIEGSSDFDVETSDRGDIPFPAQGLAPDASFEFNVVYAPPTQGPDVGALFIDYDFGDEIRTYKAEISANGAEPCIRITPQDMIDFGPSIIGLPSDIPVTIENCGNQNLVISNITLGAGTDPKFALSLLPTELVNQQGVVLAKGSFRTFNIAYTPLAEEASTGTLIIESDAPSRPIISMDIFGIGTFNNCPDAVALARVRNSGEPWADQLVAEPLDFLELDASTSSDPDGDEITDYRWIVVKAPAGFSLAFEPSNRWVEPQIQLALVGDYEFELLVMDEHGRESCEPSRVQVRAKSNKQLIIELTWRTPEDLDETDTCMGCGTDLDLHFLEPGGIWADKWGKTDCYFGEPNPEWGDMASFDDDPGLDRDDIDGGGPEQVNIKAPARTDGTGVGYDAPYQVGVYYYDDWKFMPPVLATVRIFFNGEETPSLVLPTVEEGSEAAMRLDLANPEDGQGHFWHVGELNWSAAGGEFTENPMSSPAIGFPN